MIQHKKALSEIVAYALLISISISLSIIVFMWLKDYVGVSEIEKCPDSVLLTIETFELSTLPSTTFTMNVKNRGTFNVSGFILKVHNRTNAEFGIYTINNSGVPLLPGQNISATYDFSKQDTIPQTDGPSSITLIEIQPFITEKNKNILCKSISIRAVNS